MSVDPESYRGGGAHGRDTTRSVSDDPSDEVECQVVVQTAPGTPESSHREAEKVGVRGVFSFHVAVFNALLTITSDHDVDNKDGDHEYNHLPMHVIRTKNAAPGPFSVLFFASMSRTEDLRLPRWSASSVGPTWARYIVSGSL